jgi:hypothetical protein
VKPYASGDGWVLYCGRAEEIIPDLELPAFHLITDPPYTEEPRLGRAKIEWLVTPTIKAVVAYLAGRAETAVIITGSTAGTMTVVAGLPPPRRVLAISTALGSAVPVDGWLYGLQLAYVFGPARARTEYQAGRPVFQLIPRAVARKPAPFDHPNSLPPAVGAWLAAGLRGELVLDPFCGGGGLIVGARAAGARVVGIELQERWCELAAKKLGGQPERLWRRLPELEGTQERMLG